MGFAETLEDMEKEKTGGRRVKSVDRAFDILEYVKKANGSTLTNIATDLNMSPSTVSNYLYTLRESGYLTKINSEYYIGFPLLSLGWEAQNRYRLHRIAESEVHRIINETDGRFMVMVVENDEGICLYQTQNRGAIITDKNIGDKIELHCTALGKAYLAEIPEQEAKEILRDKGLPRWTENTITNDEEFFKELEQTRERGFAINDEERVIGMRAIGAPIKTQNGEPLGSISISGPITQFKDELFYEEIPTMLLELSRVIAVQESF